VRNSVLGKLHGIPLNRGRGRDELDIAIRDYAPGAEVVIDGLVHRSEGIRPAWSARADESHLGDLQAQWNCRRCGAFGLVRSFPGRSFPAVPTRQCPPSCPTPVMPSRQLPISKQYRAALRQLSHQESPKPSEARRNTKSLTEVFGWMWPLPISYCL
jgi:hypothetical protein